MVTLYSVELVSVLNLPRIVEASLEMRNASRASLSIARDHVAQSREAIAQSLALLARVNGRAVLTV